MHIDELTGFIRSRWGEALGHADFGDGDDFFDIGGNSLLVAGIMAALGTEVGTRLSLRMFFDHPTIRELAEAVDAHLRAAARSADGEGVVVDGAAIR